MSIKQIRNCDICKKEIKNNDYLNFKIEVMSYATPSKLQRHIGISPKDVCLECSNKLGIIKDSIHEKQIVPEIQTTADQLYDIMVQIVQENTYQGGYNE